MKWGAGISIQLISATIAAITFSTCGLTAFAAAHPPALLIAADVASPQPITSTVIFTAAGPAEHPHPEYAFSLQTPGASAWVKMQDFTAMTSWTWNTTGLRPGTYGVAVDARNSGSTKATRTVMTFTLSPLPAPSGVRLSTSAATGPAPAATTSFIAAASGGTGKYEYAFHLQQSGNSVWDLKKAYSESATWAPPADLKPGTYCVCVYARTKGTAPKRGFDAYARIGFTVTGNEMIIPALPPSGTMPAAAHSAGQNSSPEFALLQHH